MPATVEFSVRRSGSETVLSPSQPVERVSASSTEYLDVRDGGRTLLGVCFIVVIRDQTKRMEVLFIVEDIVDAVIDASSAALIALMVIVES